MVIGDGGNLTYFADVLKHITFTYYVASENVTHIKNNATVTFGTLVNSNLKTTTNGCNFYFYVSGGGFARMYIQVDTGGTFYLYDSTINNNYSYSSGSGGIVITGVAGSNSSIRLWNVMSKRVRLSSGLGMDVYNWKNSYGDYSLLSVAGSFDKLFIHDLTYGVAVSTYYGLTVYNLVARNNTYVARLYTGAGGLDGHLINADVDSWSFYYDGTGAGKIYREYQYDLIVLNGEVTDFVENANVTLSKGGVQIGTWLTNSSGQIDTQTLTYGFYNQTGGNTMYDGSYPFVLTVTHEDWADYTSRFYVTEKTKMTISLQDTTTANNAALIWSLLFGALAFALFLAWWVRH